MKTAKNTTMNLVLQGLGDCRARLERIANLTARVAQIKAAIKQLTA